MDDLINIYCDESCHLLNDDSDIMALGAIWCPNSKVSEISQRIKEIKLKHGLKPKFNKNKHFHKPAFELKWNKVSASKLNFYKELIDYFFDTGDLNFRVLIVPNKKDLDHEKYNQSHDQFYYKMYFTMLKAVLNPDYSHNIYLDIKDTRSNEKVLGLRDYLNNTHYDYSKQVVKKIQQVRSHEVELIQLADLLIGALTYFHRNLVTNSAKLELIEQIKHRSKYSLVKPTLVKERKFNIFLWKSNYDSGYGQ